jgi:MFS superfamily sulfate permease-like transporter
MNHSEHSLLPKEGIEGLRAHARADIFSGFSVALLALPLSLGIAKASDFPPIMGLVTCVAGGLLVSFFAGSRLTIKGPAAGLIVIVAGAVADFGGGEAGWRLTLGALAAAGVAQLLMGALKLGRLVDFFPLSAVHGMLAAIGLIIVLKQLPVLLDVDPALSKDKPPLELLASIPEFVRHLDPRATLIGIASLAIMAGWPLIRHRMLKQVPAPLVVLLMAVPAELAMDFQHTEPAYALVHIGNLSEHLRYNADFGGIGQPGIFIRYVIMLALVGSLESLLTVKAIDMLDPWKRKSDANRDLMAIGLGNLLASLIGGLPMISEVARSSANVANGAHTRWANFFHGLFLLVFVIFAAPYIELIPNTALAAMLIIVGVRLSHPREFVRTFRIGWEQLAIFSVTILFTLLEDLLVGISAGVLLKIFIHLFHGVPIRSLFRSQAELSFNGEEYWVRLSKSAIFSNFLGVKDKLASIPPGFRVTIDLSETSKVDHSAMEGLEHFIHEYNQTGGEARTTGLEGHRPISSHPFSARIK